jgi:hypothetical protein
LPTRSSAARRPQLWLRATGACVLPAGACGVPFPRTSAAAAVIAGCGLVGRQLDGGLARRHEPGQTPTQTQNLSMPVATAMGIAMLFL